MPSPIPGAIFPGSVRIGVVTAEASNPHMNDNKLKQPAEPQPEIPAKTRRELPLVSVPNDDDTIAQEMAELFEEDKVSHQHGSSEPEAD